VFLFFVSVLCSVCEGCAQVLIFGTFELVLSLEISAFVTYKKTSTPRKLIFFQFAFLASVFSSFFFFNKLCLVVESSGQENFVL
jgi:hypothetical protein